VGPGRPGEGQGGGRGRRQRRQQQQLRRDQAGQRRTHRQARGPRSSEQPCECLRRFGGGGGGAQPELGRALRFRCLLHRRHPVGPRLAALSSKSYSWDPGRAVSFLPSPRTLRTQIRPTQAAASRPSAPGAASFPPTARPWRPCPGAQRWARPEGGPRRQPGPLSDSLLELPPPNPRKRVIWEWGGGDKGCRQPPRWADFPEPTG
jgi:hypothetical protein